jgi:serine/threonine protein phosphatase 1
LPDGLRIYIVGDIHGCFDLLEQLYREIRRDRDAAPPRECVEIFLGDYIDRGPQSREVVEWMISAVPIADRRICLMGNHEDMLLAALADASGMPNWLANGGLETFLSYKPVPQHILAGMTLARVRSDFLAALPAAHRDFLMNLPRLAEFGDYLFVHAGLRPGRALDRQDPEDLVWIREPFLASDFDFGKVVVHGHTPCSAPEIRPNRINVDTGAVFTGCLTCLILEGESRRFLQTSSS